MANLSARGRAQRNKSLLLASVCVIATAAGLLRLEFCLGLKRKKSGFLRFVGRTRLGEKKRGTKVKWARER